MAQAKTIAVNGKTYSVTLQRFDDDTGDDGPSYHGYHVTIQGQNLALNARKYDEEDRLSILSGIDEADSHAVEIVRDIARQMFGTDRLALLTQDNLSPYRDV